LLPAFPAWRTEAERIAAAQTAKPDTPRCGENDKFGSIYQVMDIEEQVRGSDPGHPPQPTTSETTYRSDGTNSRN